MVNFMICEITNNAQEIRCNVTTESFTWDHAKKEKYDKKKLFCFVLFVFRVQTDSFHSLKKKTHANNQKQIKYMCATSRETLICLLNEKCR